MPNTLAARIVALVAGAIALGLLIAAAIALLEAPAKGPVAATDKGVTGAALIGGPFTLVDQHGATVHDSDFRGRYMLVYFGYTNCPDICPTDLTAMGAAIDRLGAEGPRVVPIFITVDPTRDTVERLAAYAPLFHPRLVLLTGTADQVRQAAAAYRVYYEQAGEGGDYAVNHSAIIYLMDGQGRFVTHFPEGTTADAIAQGIAHALAGGTGSS
jgi:cytochrome oxidase Cu insertion factor (SCO1/SenC/PrrC family)